MFKPENYDSVDAVGNYQKPPAGDYIFEIISAKDTKSKNGNDMLELELDIAQGKYTKCFRQYPRRYYQLLGGEHTAFFKGMITAIENSNPSFKFSFDANNYFNPQKLVGLVVGGTLENQKIKITSKKTGLLEEIETQKINRLRSIISIAQVEQQNKDEDIPF